MIRSILLTLFNNDANSRLFPKHCYINNKSLSYSLYSTNTLTKKRLKVELCIIREMFDEKEVNLLIDVPVRNSWYE